MTKNSVLQCLLTIGLLTGCGSSGGSATKFTPPPATVSKVTPDNARGNAPFTVTIEGSNFLSVSQVLLGGVPALSFTVNSSTSITATFPGHAVPSGPLQIVVVNSGATSGVGTAFTITGGNHLLISEVCIDGGGSPDDEYIEIHNPTNAAIDLSQVYLTDGTLSTSSRFYWKIAQAANKADSYSRDPSDFIVRFPSGTSLAANGYLVIGVADFQPGGTSGTGGGNVTFFDAFGRDPDFEIRKGSDGDSIPEMVDLKSDAALNFDSIGSSIAANTGLTNGDEVVILFQWDGQTNLVQDLDYLIYGPTNTGSGIEAVSKTGVVVNGDAYKADTGLAQQDELLTPRNRVLVNGTTPFTLQRKDRYEGNEASTNGNGLTGHDETNEDLTNTFGQYDMPGSPGFGYPARPFNGQDKVPASTTIEYRFFKPVLGATIPVGGMTVTLGSTAIPGKVEVKGQTAVFTPSTPLATGTYNVSLASTIQDGGGNAFFPNTPLTYSFTVN